MKEYKKIFTKEEIKQFSAKQQEILLKYGTTGNKRDTQTTLPEFFDVSNDNERD